MLHTVVPLLIITKKPFVAGNNTDTSSSANTTTLTPNGEHVYSSNQRSNTCEDAREQGLQYDSKAGGANNARGQCCRVNAGDGSNRKEISGADASGAGRNPKNKSLNEDTITDGTGHEKRW
jgi:hypothetical protein